MHGRASRLKMRRGRYWLRTNTKKSACGCDVSLERLAARAIADEAGTTNDVYEYVCIYLLEQETCQHPESNRLLTMCVVKV